MNQKAAWSIFWASLAVFLSTLGEYISYHSAWNELGTPKAIGHIIILTATFLTTLYGALAANLPRNPSSQDRVSDIKVQELNNGSR